MTESHYPRLVLGVVVCILLVMAFLIVKPFFTALLGAIILSYVFRPVHTFLVRLVRHRTVSAVIVTFLALLLITLPLGLVLNSATQETHYLYVRAKQKLMTENLAGSNCKPEDQRSSCGLVKWINDVTSRPEVQEKIKEMLTEAITWFNQKASALLLAIPSTILSFIVAGFTMFYLIKDGPGIVHRLFRALPLRREHQEHIQTQVGNVVHATIYGSIIIAVLQGVFGILGFWAVGAPSPIIWGMIMTVFALVPLLGHWIGWIPPIASLLFDGYVGGENALLWKGFGLLVYAIVVVNILDNVIKPSIIGDRARVHPVLVMIGALGGLFVFGPIGLVIGPVTLALVKTSFEIYEQEFMLPDTKGVEVKHVEER